MNRKILLKKVAVASCFVFFFTAMAKVSGYPPIFRPNWDNGMGQSWNAATLGCISLSSDNTVYIGMTINVDPSIYVGPSDAFTDFAIRYTMSIGGTTVLTNTTASYDAFFSTTDGGYSVQQQKIIVPFDCSAYCKTPGVHFYADFTFELVVGGQVLTSLYPVGYHNSDLWPWTTYQEITGQSYVVSQSMTKEICCYSPPNPIIKVNDGDFVESSDHQSYLNNGEINEGQEQKKVLPLNSSKVGVSEEQIVVLPNPFNSILKVRLNVSVPCSVKYECFDLEGKILNKTEEQYNSIGLDETFLNLADVPSGIYYLRITTPLQTFVKKIVKNKD